MENTKEIKEETAFCIENEKKKKEAFDLLYESFKLKVNSCWNEYLNIRESIIKSRNIELSSYKNISDNQKNEFQMEHSKILIYIYNTYEDKVNKLLDNYREDIFKILYEEGV